VDLCLCRTHAHFSQEGTSRVLTLDPVDIEFRDLTVTLVSTITFPEDTGEIRFSRKIIATSKEGAAVHVYDYLTACHGTTEYPEDLTGVELRCVGTDRTVEIPYAYKCREERMQNAVRVEALVPQVHTKISAIPLSRDVEGMIREGYAFSPMYTLGLSKTLRENEELVTCLKVEKAD